MQLLDGYWTDDNNNRWNKELLTEKEAKAASRSMKNCSGCLDWAECIEFHTCSGCVEKVQILLCIEETNSYGPKTTI